MTIYYAVCFFILGACLGSFYNVVGYRMPKNESIVKPASHCPNCGYKLKPLDLIPIFSYIFLGGKCRNCKVKISPFYVVFETLTATLFMISFLVFGFTIDLAIALVFISVIIIISISDFHYMVIPDEILIIGDVLIILLTLVKGVEYLKPALISAVCAFLFLLSVKLIADKVFKKDSMGGGDIKLMFTIGLVIPLPESLLPLFMASFIALPYALYMQSKTKEPEFPFGPFLGISAIILYLTQFDLLSFLI